MQVFRSLTLCFILVNIFLTASAFASPTASLLGRWVGVLDGSRIIVQFNEAGKGLIEEGQGADYEITRYKYKVEGSRIIFIDADDFEEMVVDYALTPDGLSLMPEGDETIELTRMTSVKTLPSILENHEWTVFTIPKVAIHTEITGRNAKTTVELSVTHTTDQTYEAMLRFPLPSSATLTAYALDVEGVMIDSVAVEKARARQVFELIENENIDPSLVELTNSNELAIEIYPINQGQPRSIRFTYVESLEADETGRLIYTFPFDKIGSEAELDVKIDLLASNKFPELKHALGEQQDWKKIKHKHFRGYRYTRQRDAERLEVTLPLVLAIANTDKRVDIVEQDDFGDRYWATTMTFSRTNLTPIENAERVTLYWDTSLSMLESEAQNKAILAELLANVQTKNSKSKPLEVEVVLFANAITGSQVFAVDEQLTSNVTKYINTVAYDGATNFYPLFSRLVGLDASYSIIFSDFKPQFFNGEFQPSARPVYCITTTAPTNHSLAIRISSASGGLSLSSRLLPVSDLVALIGMRPPKVDVKFEGRGGSWNADSFIKWNIENKLSLSIVAQVPEIASKVGVSVGNGRYKTLNLNKLPLKQAGIAKFKWLSAKIDELNAEGPAAKERIVALGVRHRIPTPYTSLLVLEDIEQYVEYGIPPPAQIEYADKYDEYRAEIADEALSREDIIRALEKQWHGRVQSWQSQERKTKQDIENWKAKENKKLSASLGDGELEEVVVAGIRASMRTAEDIRRDADEVGGDLSISLSQWKPEALYYASLNNAPDAKARYIQYLTWREEYRASFNFYMDAAQVFIQHGEVEQARKILGNVLELGEGDDEAISLAAFNYLQLEDFDTAIFLFEEVIKLQPYEPSAHLNLAKAQSAKARTTMLQTDFQAAVDTFLYVALGPWEEDEPLRILALESLNRLLHTTDFKLNVGDLPQSLIAYLPMEIRLSLAWNSRTADIDLWVEEPTGERVGYSNKQGFSGGAISVDITDGYGPEVYYARYALEGEYKVYVNLYANMSAELTKPVTLTLTATTYYGYEKEDSQTQSMRVEKSGSEIYVGSIKFTPAK